MSNAEVLMRYAEECGRKRAALSIIDMYLNSALRALADGFYEYAMADIEQAQRVIAEYSPAKEEAA